MPAKLLLQALGVMVFAFLLFSCSATGDNPGGNSAVAPDNCETNATTTSISELSDHNPHSMLGSGYILIDTEKSSVEIIPSRSPSLHLNLRRFIEDGVPCTDCFNIVGLIHNPDNSWDLDIRITHPFPGYEIFTAFDTRLIIMFRGSEFWPASGLVSQDPDGNQGCVLDPDGYTTIFNSIEFPPGSGPHFFTYTQGKLASPIYPDSTLNPYMDYYSDGNRNTLAPGMDATRTWKIKLPVVTFVLGYAIDASWDVPFLDPPQNIPDDFPLEANKPEPYWIIAGQPDTLSNKAGSVTNINVIAWDWQEDVGEAWIECPQLWTGKKYHVSLIDNPPTTTYVVQVSNDVGANAGFYRALIGVKDPKSSTYPWDYTMYTFIDIEVEQLFDPCCETAPVPVFELPEHLITGQDISVVSESYDPDGDCEIEVEWDLDGDGEYDDATGDYAIISYQEVGSYQVGIKATDSCGLTSTLVKSTQVHVGITMEEDIDYKLLDTRFNMVGAELNHTTAASSVDINDTDGPWDFTGLPLTDTGNYLAILSPNHPEVQPFTDDITGTFFHFYKGSGIFNNVPGTLYLAEYYDIDPDRLMWMGIHEDLYLGTFSFFPPAVYQFPFWVFSEGTYSTGISSFNISIDWEGWGEGKVTVPFEGIENADCVVMRYKVAVSSPSINGGGMVYHWILDDGINVANVIVGNYYESGLENFDMETWTVTGNAHYAALGSIEPY